MPSEKPPARRRAADGQADLVEHLVDAALADAVAVGQPEQVVAGSPAGVHRGGVQQGTDLCQRRAQRAVGPAVDQRLALVGGVEPEDQPHRRRLAGAVGPDEAGHLAGPDGERQAVHGDGRAVALA